MTIIETAQPFIDTVISDLTKANSIHSPNKVEYFTFSINLSDPKIVLKVSLNMIGSEFIPFIEIVAGFNLNWIREKLDEGAMIRCYHVGTHADYLKYDLVMANETIDIGDILVSTLIRENAIVPSERATQRGGNYSSYRTMSEYIKNEDNNTD